MKSKCKACEQIFEVEPPVADGQELVCPYCGKLTVYRVPTRIEVPTDARRVAPRTDVRPPAEENSAASPEPVMQPVSRLHIIRPQNTAGRDSGKDNAMVESVRARARAESRRQMLRKIGTVLKDIFWILVLVVLVAGGWRLYRVWKKSKVAAETLRVEAPMPSLLEKTEFPPASVKTPDPAEDFPIRHEDAMDLLKNARVSFYGLMPASERIGTADGLFTLVIPYGESVARYYGVLSSPTGVVSAIRWIEKPIRRVPRAEYEDGLKRQGGFLVREGVAYYVTRPNSLKSWNPPLKSGEDFCASKAYFGNAHELIRKQGWKTDDLRFDVVLSFGEKVEPVPVDRVRYGERTSYVKFRKAAEPFAMKIRSRDLKKPETRGYKCTVVYYDGLTIGSSVNGITKVPRRAPNAGGAEYVRWRRLSDEARRQEGEFRRIRAENEAKMREWNRQLTASPTDEEIKKALMAASVRVIRRAEIMK